MNLKEQSVEKILISIVIILTVLLIYSDNWGYNECQKVQGSWISMNGGKHCVKGLSEVNIYQN